MWDETGNVNYNGRAKWDAWKALKACHRRRTEQNVPPARSSSLLPMKQRTTFPRLC